MAKALRSSITGALNRSIKPGLLAPAQFRGSTLDLDFAGAKSLKNQIGRQDVVSFTRASTATYVDGDGVIQSATTNTPRFDHDPATGESLGLLIEESRSNQIPDSNLWNNIRSAAVSTITGQSSPDGETNGVRIESLNVSPDTPYAGMSGNIASGDTVSVFVKPDEVTKIWLTGRYVDADGNGLYASYDFDTLQTSTGSGASNAKIEPYPNGWYRCSFTANASSPQFSIVLTLDYAKTISSPSQAQSVPVGFGVYAFGAQREAGSFPTSYIPTSGSAATRAADVAEITGADFAKTNLLTYSNFNYEGWDEAGTTPTVQWSGFTDPQGGNTAAKITFAGAANSQIRQTTGSFTSGQKYTFSVYAKALSGTQDFYLFIYDGADYQQSFTATTTWQRFSFTHTGTGGGNPSVRIRAVSPSGGEELLVWGAQLEKGSVLTDYTPSVESFTSRASSATYVDDTTGFLTTAAVDEARYENGELILEEARTNNISNNFYLSSSTNGATLSEDTLITNPDGTTGAIKLTATATLDRHRVQMSSSSESNIHSYSLFVKRGNHRYVGMAQGGAGNNVHCLFDFDTKTIFDDGGKGIHSFVSSGFEEYANGWFRLYVVGSTSGTSITAFLAENDSQNGVQSWTATGNEFMYVWGPQKEEGSYPTSYIPTSGSTVTRAADVSTSALGVDSFYNQSEGTVFVEYNVLGDTGAGQFIYSFSDGTTANSIRQYKQTGNNQTVNNMRFNGSPTGGAAGGTNTPFNERYKTAYAFDDTAAQRAIKGIASSTAAVSSMPTVDQLRLGARAANSFQATCYISRFAYFPVRLSEATLQNITS